MKGSRILEIIITKQLYTPMYVRYVYMAMYYTYHTSLILPPIHT